MPARPTGIQSCRMSAGRPWSMPYAMIAGPATCAAVDTTMIAIVSHSCTRSGCRSDPSSRRLRLRM
jgi:hypothetical protein